MTQSIAATHKKCFWSDCPNKSKNDVTLKKCSQCKSAMYCDAICQKKDWKRHKIHCVSPSALGQPGEISLATARLPTSEAVRTLSVDPQDIQRINDWLRKEYQITQTPEELEAQFAVFLSESIDQQKFVDIGVSLKINSIKSQLSGMVNDIYHRLQPYTNKSKNDLCEEVFGVVIPQIRESIVKEIKAGAKFWMNSQLNFRKKLIADICEFFDTHNFSPSKEQNNDFIRTQLAPQILASSDGELLIENIAFWNDSKTFSECLHSGIKTAQESVFMPILKKIESNGAESITRGERAVDESLEVSAEELRRANEAIITSQRAMQEARSNPSLQSLAKAEESALRAQAAIARAQRMSQESKLKAKRSIDALKQGSSISNN